MCGDRDYFLGMFCGCTKYENYLSIIYAINNTVDQNNYKIKVDDLKY